MLKYCCAILVLLFLFGCSDNSEKISELQKQVYDLQKKVNDSYKPGLGDFMSSIQIHHAKLWFAGINANWKLAEFEIEEIEESFEDMSKYQASKEEVKTIPIIYPPLDSLKKTIQKKNIKLFKERFAVLTETCNSCHKAVKYEFNKVKIPDSPPFSNQIFTEQ